MTNRCNVFKALPYMTSGIIVKGFGRGSRDLGTPTANYPLEVIRKLPNDFPTGVYFGWASVNHGTIRKMVMCIGWNPFYKNKEKSMETHILHEFDGDLYGAELAVCICGYLREEKDFKSMKELIKAIQEDVENARVALDSEDFVTSKEMFDKFKSGT